MECFLYTERDFDMDYICKNENVLIRKLRDCDDDYHLLAKWLSDPEVLTYNEGRSNPFDLEKVKMKFANRARGESHVHVGETSCWNKRAIRCYEKCGFKAIGIIKERELHDGEYKDSLIMCMTAAEPHI
jgi:hypothetical protein